jgi:hypothetical protein
MPRLGRNDDKADPQAKQAIPECAIITQRGHWAFLSRCGTAGYCGLDIPEDETGEEEKESAHPEHQYKRTLAISRGLCTIHQERHQYGHDSGLK